MKWWIRISVFIVVVLCAVGAAPVIYVGSGDNVSATVRYVALGDSIASGYGLKNPEEESYVGRVENYLEEQYDYVLKTNFGKNGQRSGELLDILSNPENKDYRKYRATLQYADIITLSIGSNDLLHLIKVDVNMEEMVRGQQEEFENACREFAENFPKIIREIRAINPDAEIYANNIYNPAKGISSFSGIYDVAEHYINCLNQAFGESGLYHLVNIKQGFDGQERSMVNVSLKGREIDPHPSGEGHELIARLVIKEIAGEGKVWYNQN